MTTNQIDQSFDEFRRIKKQYVDDACGWYEKHWKTPWLAFRAAGIGVIILSLSIPFLAAAQKSVSVSVAAFCVAVLTALNTFFSWQGAWEKRVRLWRTLKGLSAMWEIKIAAASAIVDVEARRKEALEATLTLIEETKRLDVGETEALLTRIKFPEAGEIDQRKPLS